MSQLELERITVTVQPACKRELQRLAYRDESTISTIVRKAINEYVADWYDAEADRLESEAQRELRREAERRALARELGGSHSMSTAATPNEPEVRR